MLPLAFVAKFLDLCGASSECLLDLTCVYSMAFAMSFVLSLDHPLEAAFASAQSLFLPSPMPPPFLLLLPGIWQLPLLSSLPSALPVQSKVA